MPSEGRGGLGRNRSTVSSRPEARSAPFARASKRRRGLGSNRFFSSSMSQSKGTPFGGQVTVANDSGGTALPSPRAWKRRVPPLVGLAKGGAVSEVTVFKLHPCRSRRVPALDAK